MDIAVQAQTLSDLGLTGGENGILAKRPYISTNGRFKGQPVVAFNTGTKDESGNSVYAEKPIQTNAATLRKNEWINLEDAILESFRERLVIVDDLRSAGLTYDVGGLGTVISEWETASEMTDAEITMDGESKVNKDRQQFGLHGVPVPVIQKQFSISERALLASRQRGAALDVTMGTEAARAVARVSESLIFNGASITTGGYGIPGLLNYSARATTTISDWSNPAVSPATILAEILAMVTKLETEERRYGSFKVYIPGAYASRFREDFKANSDKTLMQRVLEEQTIEAVRVADMLTVGNVVMIEMKRDVIDLAVASDVNTVQWQSGSGWTNHFQVFAAWAPRLKSDYDGRCGICHGAVAG